LPASNALRTEGGGYAAERAVEDALLDPENHTPDLGGSATTEGVTQAIIKRIAK
jgi:isocitrate/isopropylmalate dehydrogenase